ncbi:MAG: transcription factor [Lasallia pustulata]|uniref:Transcription factor n=1 Tax=Lasallia pustulata TaxID=136370 RepID=A0A5M8Q511_9LECA|nr:MAG: transcription factor [Lasallia pustulata]
MELRRNLCVLPSNAPVQERSDCSKRVFQDTSGNLQSSPVDNVDALTKESYDSQVTSRSPPASTQQVRTTERPDHKGRRHVRKLPILTKSELNSEKYLAYRARQRANIGKDGEPVWPDDLEEAFQRALRAIPPMGRMQRTLGAKACGRNELIAHSIKLWTGKVRKRKQVSSHIQVLKNFMKDNAAWMKLVTADKTSDQFNTQTQNGYYDSTAGHLVTADSSTRLSQDNDGLGILQDSYSNGLPPPAGTLGSNAPIQDPSIQRINFEMWVHPPTDENQGRNALHTYTSSQSEISALSMVLEDIRHWRSAYPYLNSLHQDGQLHGTELILLEANFDLMDAYPPKGSKLGIRLQVDLAHTKGYHSFKYFSNFYQTGTPDPMHSCGDGLKYMGIHRNDTVRLDIPLESKWWVLLFHKITERRFAEEATGDPQAIRADEEQTRQYFREMSVMQEVFATPDGASAPQRLEETPRAPPRIATNSPAPPPLLPSQMTIDTVMHDALTPQATPLYPEFFHPQADLLTDPHLPGPPPRPKHAFSSFDSSLSSASLPSAYHPIRHDPAYCSATAPVPTTYPHPDAADFAAGHIQIHFHDQYDDSQLAYPPPQEDDLSQQQQQQQQQERDQYEANNQWAAAYHASMFAGVEFQHQG